MVHYVLCLLRSEAEIKGFLFCFEIFHYGFSLRIGKFGKYKKYI